MSTQTSNSISWGVDSEYGVLRDVLVGRPDFFEWRPISAIARRTLQNLATLGIKFDQQTTFAQHREMVHIYEELGVTVHYLDADEALHCNVYARDSSAMTPWGPLVCHIQTKYRRADYVPVFNFYHRAGIPIWKGVTAAHFEGGDLVIVEPGAVMIGYGGERSEEAGAMQVAGWFQHEGWETLVVPFPAHFVHMDATVGMIARKLAAVCVDALEDYVVDWLKARQVEILPVGYKDCVNLGVNIMSLGGDRVLSLASNMRLNEQLRARGLHVYAPDVSMFQYGGGGVHCLAQSLRRDPG